jgi:thioester reductase-like protein
MSLTPPGTRASDPGVLLTGATGFVGIEVLARYLERSDSTVYALVRADDEGEATARMRAQLASFFGHEDPHAGRVVAVPGDIERPGLGLDEGSRRRLAERVSAIVHVAASVTFSLPLEEARRVNREGTARLLEFADLCMECGGLRLFSYVSTAYVAGTHSGTFHEHELGLGQGFRNSYERSKFEAEQLVRSYADRVPIQIFRPSIVVGERDSGWTASFNVVYAPLRAFTLGAFHALPGRRSAPVDVVSVDYVADAMFELATSPAHSGDTYHLVAGRQAATVGRLMELSADYFGRQTPPLLPPALYRTVVHRPLLALSRPRRRRTLRLSEAYFPYFSTDVIYDDFRARTRLDAAGIMPAPVERYFERLADFAVATRWGKEPMTRAEAHAAAAGAGRGELRSRRHARGRRPGEPAGQGRALVFPSRERGRR